MKFFPNYPENMLEEFAGAMSSVYHKRDLETRHSFMRPYFKANKPDNNSSYQNISLRDSILTEEVILYSIAESQEVADTVSKFNDIVLVPAKFWLNLIEVAIQMREQVRVSDKRGKEAKIKILTKIRDQLNKTAKMIETEAVGFWSEGLRSGNLHEETGPFDRMLLSEVYTTPFVISGKEIRNDAGDRTFRFQGRMWSKTVGKANTSLANEITNYINEIKSRESSIRPKRGIAGLRECEASLESVFENNFSAPYPRRFVTSKNKLKTAVISCVLDIPDDENGITPEGRVKRAERYRSNKK